MSAVRTPFVLAGLAAAAVAWFYDPARPNVSFAPILAPTSSTVASEAPTSTAQPRPQAPPSTLAVADLPTWEWEIARVEEVRGSAGPIVVPEPLKHYDDRRRFLALQMADSREEDYSLPHDQAELVQMIQRGELVELSPLAPDYILYEVGTDAREDPLAHYDAKSGKDVRLFASREAYQEEDARLSTAAEGKGRGAAKARERREFLASFYGDPDTSRQLFEEHAAVTALAENFRGSRYDLSDAADRARFQARLLSFVRPQAREVLLQVAHVYQERFGRLLPITSAIRTQRYQRRLSGVNPNATDVNLPPHTTGMAFDISYKFMAPDEQNLVMHEVARLEEEGRVEALRERRNHIHVYTFADGRPAETLVADFLDDVEAAHPQAAPRAKAKERPASRRTSSRRRSHGRTARAR